MTYIQRAVDAVNAEMPNLPPDLARLYALLALTTGDRTTSAHVHDGWAVWKHRIEPADPRIVPYAEMPPQVQALDDPYVEGIRRATRRLAAELAGEVDART